MRRPATWLVVGAIALLAGVAAVETWLGDNEGAADPAEATTQGPSQPGLPDRLEAAGASGLLYVSVRRDAACRIQSIRLPTLDVETDVTAPDCRFAVASNGMLATGFDCDEPGALQRPDGAVVDRFVRCAPAFKPTGELTFLRDGRVMAVPRSCSGTVDECARAVLTPRDVQRGLPVLAGGRPWTVREIAWLDETTVAAVVRGTAGSAGFGPTTDAIVVFQGRRPVAAPSFGTGMLAGLAVDRASRRVFVSGNVVQGIFELDESGRFARTLTVPGIPEVASVSFSPDGSWAAAAGRGSVLVFQPGDPPGRSFQLPFEVESLVWREP
jgi:hypothetical protein